MSFSPELMIAVVGGGLATALVSEVFRFFRPRHEIEKSRAEAAAAVADGDAKIIDATAKMFETAMTSMQSEMQDLRGRLSRVEGEVVDLRREKEHLIRENEDLRVKLDIATGEVRQLQQVLSSRARYDQDAVEDPALPKPETEQ